jgi:hypothetical protein
MPTVALRLPLNFRNEENPMKNLFVKYFKQVACSALMLASAPIFAQAESGTTTTPTKVYASVGGALSFTVNYTGPETAQTDLLVTHTANTSSPVLTVFRGAGNCVSPTTPAGYVPPTPANALYVLWEPTGSFPANCGTTSASTPMATVTGTVASFPGAGSYVIEVLNNAAGGSTNVAGNDVLVCQKRTVQSVTAPANFVEGGSGTFTITLDAAVATGCGGFSVPFTMSGPAVAGKSATPTSGTCTFADGATSCVTGAISTSQNALIDGDMALTLTVTNSAAGDSYVSTGNKAGTVTVLDDEVGASVVATTQASETGPTNGVVTFARTGSTAAALNLTSAISGTATYTTDYSITAGSCAIVSQSASTITVTVPAAAASCTINIVPVDDVAVEGNETVIFGVPTGVGVAGTGSAATITITDNDSDPVFALAQVGACAEPATNCAYTLNRVSGVTASRNLTFTVSGTATRGTDYDLKSGADCATGTTIPVGTNSVTHNSPTGQTLNVCVIDDLIPEAGGETVILTLNTTGSVAGSAYTLGSPSTATFTIADDDSPQVITVAVSGSPASENGGMLTYTFTRTGGSAAAQAATLAINITPPPFNARYSTTCTSPQTFAASTATKTCTVTGVNDALLNGNLNVVVGVAAPAVATDYTVGSPATATGVLNDDEVGVSVAAVNGVVSEGGLVTFTISCTGSASTSVPFTLTGTIGTDVVGGATSPIALTCGTAQTVTVQTVNNSIQGDNRSITLTLGTPTGGNAALVPGASSSTVSILDDDGPKIVPTMGMLGLGLMSLMLAGLAAFQRRRSMK